MTVLGFESKLPRLADGGIVCTQSDLVAFKKDRREWMLNSYLGLRLKDKPPTGALILGTRVHNALERYYGYGEDLVEAYDKFARAELQALLDSGKIYYEQTWRAEAELGRIMVSGYEDYLAETGVDADLEVVSAEEKLSHVFDINGTQVELRGKIDLRVFNKFTEQYMVADFKTCKTFESFTETAHLSEQLKTYMTLEMLTNLDNPDHHLGGAMFIMFRKVKQSRASKPPYYARYEVHHSKARLRGYYQQLLGTLEDYLRVVQALDAGVDHRKVAYPNPHPFTRYSEYKNAMDMMDDPGIEDMLHTLYKQYDPHARYSEEPADLLSQLG
jgi:hypothetical protein